jgi:NADH-quinone oxidoreductase E subunit
VQQVLIRYPDRRSAILPLLEMAQALEGHVSRPAMEEIGAILEVSPAYVYSVATFYTMLHIEPVGRRRFYVCQTLSCALAGAEELIEVLGKRLGIGLGETTPDGLYSLFPMECLGSCGTGPVIMLNNVRYSELVDRKKLEELVNQPFEEAEGGPFRPQPPKPGA